MHITDNKIIIKYNHIMQELLGMSLYSFFTIHDMVIAILFLDLQTKTIDTCKKRKKERKKERKTNNKKKTVMLNHLLCVYCIW